jgi:hypothetical protein
MNEAFRYEAGEVTLLMTEILCEVAYSISCTATALDLKRKSRFLDFLKPFTKQKTEFHFERTLQFSILIICISSVKSLNPDVEKFCSFPQLNRILQSKPLQGQLPKIETPTSPAIPEVGLVGL